MLNTAEVTGVSAPSASNSSVLNCRFFFFFQAEDGIRDSSVTGVQTCALPIFRSTASLESCLMNRMQQSVESTQAIAESDAIAVERTLAGDRDAYRVLVERHSHNLFRLAYRMTGNRHDAEEVVQEAFLRGDQKLGQFAARSNFGAWGYRIAANYANDRLGQRQKGEL